MCVYIYLFIYNSSLQKRNSHPVKHTTFSGNKNMFSCRIFQALPLHYDGTLARWLPWLPKEVGGSGTPKKSRWGGCILLVCLLGRFIHLSFRTTSSRWWFFNFFCFYPTSGDGWRLSHHLDCNDLSTEGKKERLVFHIFFRATLVSWVKLRHGWSELFAILGTSETLISVFLGMIFRVPLETLPQDPLVAHSASVILGPERTNCRSFEPIDCPRKTIWLFGVYMGMTNYPVMWGC